MGLLQNIIRFVLKEAAPLYGNTGKRLSNAISDRHPVTFYYSGPETPEKESVKRGYRVNAEMVALGVSKKGNLIVRAWVDRPSQSKKGFGETNWRTFIVNRMSDIVIKDDETFDEMRPGYKEGDDNSMSVTYVTSDWSTTPEPKTIEKSEPMEPSKTDEPTTEPASEPTPDTVVKTLSVDDLPQPKPEEKPSEEPPIAPDEDEEEEEGEDDENNNKELQESINRMKQIIYY